VSAALNSVQLVSGETPIFGEQREWPVLGDDALHGPVGEVVNLVMPHTEGDQAALLTQTLAGLGNLAGRIPCRTPDELPHWLNLFVLILGNSSKARKGSYYHAIDFCSMVDREWARDNVKSGLTSGEGLVWWTRDPIYGIKTRKGQQIRVLVDEGIADKRLLAAETEFSSVRKVMGRDGNILSQTLRQAFESGHLRVLAKNFPAAATNAHVSLIGHTTLGELAKYFTETEAANGFGNRFLFVLARRSKVLSQTGKADREKLQKLAQQVRTNLKQGNGSTLTFGADANNLWDRVYAELSAERHGMYGDVVARSEAQVSRLAFVYTAIDGLARWASNTSRPRSRSGSTARKAPATFSPIAQVPAMPMRF
jgi:hypothetical protein